MTATGPQPSHGQAPATAGLTEIQPIRTDGLRIAVVGTGLWLVATAVLLPLQGRLRASDDGWWLAVCATGSALGFVGIVVLLRRRSRERRAAQSADGAAS